MKRNRQEPRVLFPHQEQGVLKILHGFCAATYAAKSGINRPAQALLLHDDMGLGKTIQALEALRRMMETDRLAAPILIVAPAACLHVWQTEISTWFADCFTDVRLFINDAATAETLQRATPRTIIITSYSTLRAAFQTFLFAHLSLGTMSNAELARLCVVGNADPVQIEQIGGERALLLQKVRTQWNAQADKGILTKKYAKTTGYSQLVRLEYSCLIMDEIHTIKNASSKTCKAVAFVSARYRLGLSGTPTMNNGAEMLTILKYGLGLFDVDWSRIYREPDGPYCRALLGGVCFGRRKADVPELVDLLPTRDAPEAEQIVLGWSEDKDAEALYVKIRERSVAALGDINALRQQVGENREDYNIRRSTVTQHFWTMFQQLRQVCLHPFLIAPENAGIPHGVPYTPDTAFAFPLWLQRRCALLNQCLVRWRMPLAIRNHLQTLFVQQERHAIQPSAKMNHIMGLIKRQAPKKVVIVSQFRAFLETILGPWLTRNGIGCALFAGGTRARQQAALDAIHNDPACTVLLVVKSAGAQGLNLQAASATVVITEPHFNDALDEQASQRVDRIGQLEKTVVIRKLFMQGSVDIALKIMQQKKTEITESWLGRNENALSLESVGLFLINEDRVGK